MSRVGKKPIPIPDNVELKIETNTIMVEGPRGKLEERIPKEIKVKLEGGKVWFTPVGNSKKVKALWGLTRSLANNMVIGVTVGFKKVLEVRGREYKVRLKGKNLDLDLGYSHPIQVSPKEGIEFGVDGSKIIVKGIDKALVGEQTAEVRDLRPPEVYKGKGIRYEGEYVIQKKGKKGL
ncbi:MAG: 50S ribosomal protein L6 [candidate division WOR-3 bacterium]|nr:50S ribosomal protein L6 [candidate division WOR-3 bacterium]